MAATSPLLAPRDPHCSLSEVDVTAILIALFVLAVYMPIFVISGRWSDEERDGVTWYGPRPYREETPVLDSGAS